MCTLTDLVSLVICDFTQHNILFTALDVSNKVKETMPLARHREVRNAVRNLYTSDIQSVGYSRTPICVELEDGTTTDALLYHPTSDTWDLDNKYDSQQRHQKSMKPTNCGSIPTNAMPTVPVPMVKVTPPAVSVAPVPTTTQPTTLPTTTNPKDLWANLFSNQPSLFPRK